ncbi:hypothetical protein HHL19_12845 [Streptomyces sp. R302]|uniref:hypothetical protein n=1 Tax=unclassified Streptomyces TaxID=2593676 RepID=UPI00145C8510|nr:MULTISPECIES: hypothetical protein [unclassified Streptomyces]NML50548.1 hypothetical protein [Streptomyces sp. R301]NML79539.1 hypothetical protein [Streptomyces sp. R302]
MTEIATDGIEASGVKVSTRHNNVSFEAPDIDALVSDVQGSRGYDDRVPWEKYEVAGKVWESPSQGFLRHLSLSVTADEVRMHISGADHIWVHGQAARIQLFLANRYGRERELPFQRDRQKAAQSAVTLALFIWFYVFGVSQVYLSSKPNGENAEFWADAALYSAIPALATLTWSLILRLTDKASKKGKVNFTEDVPVGSIWQRMDWQTRILAMTLIIAGIAAIGTLVSAGADVFKP